MGRAVGFLNTRLIAVGLLTLALGGCATGNLSSFGGSSQARIPELTNAASYSADAALAEARSHFRNNDFGYSAALYKRLVELSPNDPQGYVGLSASYDRLGRFDLSDRVYASLYRISGGTAQYYNNVGYSYMLRGNVSAALASFRKASALDPNNVVIANNVQMLANSAASSRA
ncbi:MAG: tetratricopeptide repeat protein [Devosia sp.]